MTIPAGTAQLTALGGMSEVGASCYLYEFPQGRLLIDAGLRQSTTPASPPNLEKLRGKRPDWMILTHAHLDHVGALPQVIDMFPTLQVYATVETCSLAKIVLDDAANISKNENGKLSQESVNRALSQLRPFQKGKVLTLKSPQGEIQVSTRGAGHLMGAVSLRIQSGELIIEHSADISAEATPTTDPAILPKGGAHVMVCESTYGNRDLPPRRQQVSEMIKVTREILEQKGRILIPSFALGRAQDVSWHLSKAMQQGLIPRAPLYIDGMCRAAARVCEEMNASLPGNTRLSEQPFTGNGIVLVRGEDREKIIKASKPAVIIASSGMLTGGVSPQYALKISQEKQSAIMLVGYQEPDSPGGRLRGAQQGDKVKLGNQEVKLLCQVHQVQLSGHADREALATHVSAANPHTVILMHGDDQAREGLRGRLAQQGREVLTPENEDILILSLKKRLEGRIRQVENIKEEEKEKTPQEKKKPEDKKKAYAGAKQKNKQNQKKNNPTEKSTTQKSVTTEQDDPKTKTPTKEYLSEEEKAKVLRRQERIRQAVEEIYRQEQTGEESPLFVKRRTTDERTKEEKKLARKLGLATDARSRRRFRREKQRKELNDSDWKE